MNIFKLSKIGKPEQIREAVKKGAVVNDQLSDGLTPLFIVATENDYADSLRTFIELGADIHARYNNGATPLCANIDVASNEGGIYALFEVSQGKYFEASTAT